MDYLAQLIHEKSTISAFPNHFKHTDRLIDLEIARVRAQLFQCNFDDDLPKLPELESHEDIVTLQERMAKYCIPRLTPLSMLSHMHLPISPPPFVSSATTHSHSNNHPFFGSPLPSP
uniref:STAR protein homodimerisation region domain-containing protein n=1 Tax=Meloidogyne javanica TaxID=6303 RepID=A0A915LE30_MELJA